jgi:hypothetical protein
LETNTDKLVLSTAKELSQRVELQLKLTQLELNIAQLQMKQDKLLVESSLVLRRLRNLEEGVPPRHQRSRDVAA